MSSDTLEILGKYGKEEIAILYVAKYQGKILEFVESVQPPITRDEKWVLILSTLYGCPMKCLMCDSGDYYHGYVTKEAMLAQLDYMISNRFPDKKIDVKKLKIQFARMGEPALNPDVIPLLRELPYIYNAPGLLPCVSTVAPKNTDDFFSQLIKIKNNLYPNGQFQLQFSIHSSDPEVRKIWIPKGIWSFSEIAEFGERWYVEGDRKITLNFAVAEDSIIEKKKIAEFFSPNKFLIKLTPINPTNNAVMFELNSGITEENKHDLELAKRFRSLSFETIVSIGQWEENLIGSNCGQKASEFVDGKVRIKENYSSRDYSME
ncbi:MAG: radical SAM protein [Promethearchaeota archaeon]